MALDQVRGGVPACLRVGRPRQSRPGALHRLLQRQTSAFVAGHEDTRRVLLRDAAGDQTGSMSDEHECPPRRSCVASKAPHARRRGQLCTAVLPPSRFHLSKPVRCSDKRSHLFPQCAVRLVGIAKPRLVQRCPKRSGRQRVLESVEIFSNNPIVEAVAHRPDRRIAFAHNYLRSKAGNWHGFCDDFSEPGGWCADRAFTLFYGGFMR